VYYNSVTPESSENGDVSDEGFLLSFNRFHNLEDAVDRIIIEGAYYFSSSEYDEYGWYSTGYSSVDYKTLTETEHTFHFDETFTSEERLVFYHMFMLKTRGIKNA